MKYKNINIYDVNNNVVGTLSLSWNTKTIYIGKTYKIEDVLGIEAPLIEVGSNFVKTEDVHNAIK
jgi:hypothetical protein